MKRIALHGVPRPGTTWLGSIFDSSPNVAFRNQPLFSYAFKSFLDHESSLVEIQGFFNQINASNDDYINQKQEKENNLVPIFSKSNQTHIVYKETRYHHIVENLLKTDPNLKIVGIVRNPLSVINSWIRAPKEFNSNWNIEDEWIKATKKNQNKKEEFFGYQKWKDVSLLFERLNIEYSNFHLVEYKQLICDRESIVDELFDFCEIEITDQTINFLNTSKTDDNAYSVFKNIDVDNKWKDSLPSYIVESIQKDLENTILEKYVI